jgi:hypothetical protein
VAWPKRQLQRVTGPSSPGGGAYKVGHGYILGLPVAAYLTWQGRMPENNGIIPKVAVQLSRDALKQERDIPTRNRNRSRKDPVRVRA